MRPGSRSLPGVPWRRCRRSLGRWPPSRWRMRPGPAPPSGACRSRWRRSRGRPRRRRRRPGPAASGSPRARSRGDRGRGASPPRPRALARRRATGRTRTGPARLSRSTPWERASHHHQVAPVWRQDLAARLGHGDRLAEAGGHEPRDPERPHSVEGRAGLEDSSEPSTIQMESSDHSGGKPRPTG